MMTLSGIYIVTIKRKVISIKSKISSYYIVLQYNL
jgi:hypothetical protein